MAYFLVSDFARGIDRRRLVDTAPSGSLWDAVNVFINEGGQIEKRLAFTENTTVSTALRHDVCETFGPIRGIVESQAIFCSNVTRTTLNTAGKWPTDSTTNTPLDYGDGEIWWLDPALIPGTLPVHGWHVVSGAYQAEDLYQVVFAGYGTAGGTKHDELRIPYEITAAGTPTPGENSGASVGYFVADHQTPLSDPVFNTAHLTKVYRLDGFKLTSGFVAGGATGDGDANLQNQGDYIGNPLAVMAYYNELAVIGSQGAQFWSMDQDWAESRFIRALRDIGLASPRSVTKFGAGDILYLGRNGVRSLTARDSSNYAKISDVGSPIDPLTRGDSAAALSVGIVNPDLGQVWLFLGDYCYVLSQFPSSKVLAWTRYSMPATSAGGHSDFTTHPSADPDSGSLTSEDASIWCADAATLNYQPCFRTYEDRFFVYGGTAGATYDAAEAQVQTPYYDFGKPGHTKTISAFDIACSGTWTVEASFDPFNVIWEDIATVTNSTYREARIPMSAVTEHISIRLTTTDASKAIVGQIAIHYELGSQG